VDDGLNGRPNKRLNATAHSVAFINVVRGGALSAAFGGWWRITKLRCLISLIPHVVSNEEKRLRVAVLAG
jgi:hypothetical protein